MRRDWIEVRLKKLKRRKSDLGEALSLPPSRVSEMINGRRRIQTHEISGLADFLKFSREEIIQLIENDNHDTNLERGKPTETIMVSGSACQKNSTYSFWPETNRYIISLPISSKFSSLTKYAFVENTTSQAPLRIYICVSDMNSDQTGEEFELEGFVPKNIFQCNDNKDMHQIGEYREF